MKTEIVLISVNPFVFIATILFYFILLCMLPGATPLRNLRRLKTAHLTRFCFNVGGIYCVAMEFVIRFFHYFIHLPE